MSDYSELKKAAEAAIQIEWERLKSGLNDRYPSDYADHIISASPAAVLALIAENERLEAEVMTANKVAEGLQEMIRRQNKTHCRLADEIKQLKKAARNG